jgi:hypothetical protein
MKKHVILIVYILFTWLNPWGNTPYSIKFLSNIWYNSLICTYYLDYLYLYQPPRLPLRYLSCRCTKYNLPIFYRLFHAATTKQPIENSEQRPLLMAYYTLVSRPNTNITKNEHICIRRRLSTILASYSKS